MNHLDRTTQSTSPLVQAAATPETIELVLQSDYRFEVDFRMPGVPTLVTDSTAPLGQGAGPDSEKLLLAAKTPSPLPPIPVPVVIRLMLPLAVSSAPVLSMVIPVAVAALPQATLALAGPTTALIEPAPTACSVPLMSTQLAAFNVIALADPHDVVSTTMILLLPVPFALTVLIVTLLLARAACSVLTSSNES